MEVKLSRVKPCLSDEGLGAGNALPAPMENQFFGEFLEPQGGKLLTIPTGSVSCKPVGRNSSKGLRFGAARYKCLGQG